MILSRLKSDQSKGARPKIRNPKDAKRQRFVMKQAKTISKPQPLESVSETEEGQALLSKINRQRRSINIHRKKESRVFGVRSYVHTFYEAMAMDNPHAYEESYGYVLPSRKRKRQVLCWRLTLGAGVVTFCWASYLFRLGFSCQKKEVIDIQEDIEIIDRAFLEFNKDLDVFKIVGMVLFSAGGLVMAGVLIAVTLMWRNRSDDPLSSEEIPLTGTESRQDEGPKTPMDVKVPATEEVTAVQPKRLIQKKS
ncbi:uncharacterized protein CEXT_483331 [Caerostris extrusa]|uniref:Uncharacterized protein n=1 Tax=Caerostris extrusa TaxID=172846 RepID=A0AAV4U8K5_CAEEX|nr:uncharacterized protein CEXT_483331 [Caerostris extrusa]